MTQSVQVTTVSRVQSWRGSLLTLGTGPAAKADVFSGWDTYGWPDPQTQLPWSPRWGGSPVTLLQTLATVPNVVGQPQNNAQAAAASVGLVLLVSSSQISNLYPAGYVISQVPAPGTQVGLGTSLNVILSLGPFPGLLLQDAISIMVNAGLIVSQPIQWVPDPIIPRGYMVAQSPAAGSAALPNTLIFLTASLGPPNVQPTLIVPNVVGKNVVEAQGVLSIAGFNAVNPIWVTSASVPDTYVISQSVPPGTPFPSQTPVTLTVSMGTYTPPYSAGTIVLPQVVTR